MAEGERDALIGTVVGDRYRIERELGQGGMGTVYRAEHVELRRPVAVKVLISDVLATETAVGRFLREARSAAAIGHPNIVTVHDLGRLPNGRPYLAMELLEGDSLDTILSRDKHVAPERVAWIVDGAARALDAIHDLSLVHRDVKPENLFVARLGDGSEAVKLVDFGLVGLTRADPDAPRLTQTGLVDGTPGYMAPEAMAEKTPDPQWDVYSLAVVAFELLSGYLPLDDENPLELLSRRVREDPPSLFERCGTSFSPAIEEAVRIGLSRFKDRRYRRAGELADALRRAAGEPAAVAQPTRPRGATVDVPIRLSPEPRREAARSAVPDGPDPGPGPEGPGTSRDSAVEPHSQRSINTPMGPGGSPASLRDDDNSRPIQVPGMRRRLVPVAAALALAAGLAVAITVGWIATSGGEDGGADTAAHTAEAASEPPATSEQGDRGRGAREGSPTGESATTQRTSPTVVQPDRTDPATHGPDRAMSTNARGAKNRPPRRASPSKTPSEAPRMREADPSPEPAVEQPDRASVHAEAARLLARGNVGGARARYAELTRSRPGDAAAWRGLGVAAERLGRSTEARTAYERYLALAPEARDADAVRRRLERLE